MPQLAYCFSQVSILELILKNAREGAYKCITLSQCTMSNMPVKPLEFCLKRQKSETSFLHPCLTTPQTVVGLEEAEISFFPHLKQRQCRTQKEDVSAYSQSSFHRMDLWIGQVFLFVTQTNFKQKSAKWSKHGNAWGHFSEGDAFFRLWPCICSKHTRMLLPYDVGALCYCISNLQRVSRKQLLLKKLQLTTWSLPPFSVRSQEACSVCHYLKKYLVATSTACHFARKGPYILLHTTFS